MDLNKLTFSQRFAAGCGCVVMLVMFVAAFAYVAIGTWMKDRAHHDVATAPAGWMDSIRAQGRAPDVSGLTLERTDSGDGAALARALRPRPGTELAYRAAVGLVAATREDSARWREVAADTSLNRVIAIARRKEWRAVEVSLAGADSNARRNLLLLPLPQLVAARDAARSLVIRAMVRLSHGDRAGARADLSAATGLGEQAFYHEPTILGMLMGRAQLSSASRGWERYAERTGDSALAGRLRELLAWASRRPTGISGPMMAAPDSALAIARDSTLALGVRGEALSQFIGGRALTPRGMVFGMPSRELRSLEALAKDADPDMRPLASVALASARRLRFFGLFRMMRETGTRNR